MAKKSYAAAAKEYYASQGKNFQMPKKDSDDYKAIRAIMARSGAAAAAAGDATGNSAVSAEASVLEKKVRKSRPKKEVKAKGPGPSQDTPTKAGGNTLLIDQPHVTAQAVAEVVPDSEAAPKKKRAPRAVQRDGLTPQQDLLNANTVENSSMHIVPANYPGLADQIKKVLEVKPEGVPTRKKRETKAEMMLSKTTEGKRTDDAPAVEARAPFSFQSLRHLLRQ